MTELRAQALLALQADDCMVKVGHVAMLANALDQDRLTIDVDADIEAPEGLPGRPAKPVLVHPRDVPKRGIGSDEGRAALLHALAHIEFNAINLALDAIWRFARMPHEYYREWCSVAAEEAYHFCLLKDRIESFGFTYGDFPAHHGLWEMAEKTTDDPLARMALVPRTLEARGLDVTPAIRAKFASVGDEPSAKVLDIILRDEIKHVAVGNRWYAWLCTQQGRDPEHAHDEIARQYAAALPRAPFNTKARLQAGFGARDLERWREEGWR